MGLQITKIILMMNGARNAGRKMLNGIARYAQIQGSWIFYKPVPYYRRSIELPGKPFYYHKKIIELIKTGDADGIITDMPNLKVAQETIPKDFPAVFMPLEEVIHGYVNLISDVCETGKLAAEYCMNLGYKNFGFCGENRIYWSRARLESFQNRLSQSGYTPYIYSLPKPSQKTIWEHQQETVAKWLKSLPKPIAIWAWNDEMGECVIEACRLLNILVPDEVSVLGADNDELVCRLCDPLLSSIAFNFEKAGFEMAHSLHKLINGETLKNDSITLLPSELKIRSSTNPHCTTDIDVAKALKFIYSHATKPIQVSDVVEEICLSRRTLYERFKKHCGCSIYQEIRKARINKMADMLLNTNYSVSRIAYLMGFSNEQHIYKFFKKAKGLTPKAFRDKHCIR